MSVDFSCDNEESIGFAVGGMTFSIILLFNALWSAERAWQRS